ncbi:MAG: DUF1501 domain-containing protein [Lentisphaeria bacterium]|nr:DUF1501 domain-containing protein [Lentisphaeria bacterium]
MKKKSIVCTRRDFIRKSMGLVALSSTTPSFLTQAAAYSSKHRSSDDSILVIIQLSGGNDGLNTVIPFMNDIYYESRPTIAIPKDQCLRLTDEIGLHPGMIGFKRLYEQGRLNIIQGVGYPNPDRSHFRSMDIWNNGSTAPYTESGWIGRIFDHECNNAHLKKKMSPTKALSISNSFNPSLRNQNGVGIAVQNPQKLYNQNKAANKTSGEAKSGNNELDFIMRTAMNAQVAAEDIYNASRKVKNKHNYPNNRLSADLKTVARLIAGGMNTRVYYLNFGGFDTHNGQLNKHHQLLTQLADAINAFQEDLIKLKVDDRVMGFTFSEFGRRVAENANAGTDHGQGAPSFVFGNAINPGIIGAAPDLAKLNRGDVAYQVDFRSIYSTILDKWLGIPSKEILNEHYEHLKFI